MISKLKAKFIREKLARLWPDPDQVLALFQRVFSNFFFLSQDLGLIHSLSVTFRIRTNSNPTQSVNIGLNTGSIKGRRRAGSILLTRSVLTCSKQSQKSMDPSRVNRRHFRAKSGYGWSDPHLVTQRLNGGLRPACSLNFWNLDGNPMRQPWLSQL